MAWQPFSKDESDITFTRSSPEAHFFLDSFTPEELYRDGIRLDGAENHPFHDSEFRISQLCAGLQLI